MTAPMEAKHSILTRNAPFRAGNERQATQGKAGRLAQQVQRAARDRHGTEGEQPEHQATVLKQDEIRRGPQFVHERRWRPHQRWWFAGARVVGHGVVVVVVVASVVNPHSAFAAAAAR